MNMNDISGKWHEIRGSMKEYFADLTDDDILEIEADHDKLVGILQQRYDMNAKAAELAIENMHVTADGRIQDVSMHNKNQGEGDVEAVRRFNAEQHKFAQKNDHQ